MAEPRLGKEKKGVHARTKNPAERRSATILAVNSDEAIGRTVNTSLREAGYEVVEAQNGKEALGLFSRRPDLILLDINLPDIDGHQLCKQIKSNPETSFIPIIQFSFSRVEPEARVQGLESGADAYLAGPIDRGELVATIGALLRLKRAETTARQQAELAEKAHAEVTILNETLERRVSERTAALYAANRSLRELSGRLLRLQDEERKRIARELHDGIGQLLAAIAMNQGKIWREAGPLPPSVARALQENTEMIGEVIQGIRTISHLLHPPLLDVSGLGSALQSYADEFGRRSGIEIEVDIPNNVPRLQAELETTIFRVIQECLGNIHRHSGSKSAHISVGVADGFVHVVVRDNGKGIPDDVRSELEVGTRGVGLRGMRERVGQFGGQFNIESDGNGTTIRAKMPFVLLADADV